MLENIDAVIVEPTGAVDASVIWLHGLGADGHDFEGIIPQLALPEDHGIRFVFPHAPIRAVTVNSGAKMRAWYDIGQVDLTQEVDWQGIEQSVQLLRDVMAQQVSQGIAVDRIMVAGFSQGGVIALHAGLRSPEPLAGIIALSTYLPELPAHQIKQSTDCPIFMAHGLMDPICPLAGAEQAFSILTDNGFLPSWQVYPMQHQVCMEEITDLSRFIQQNLLKKTE